MTNRKGNLFLIVPVFLFLSLSCFTYWQKYDGNPYVVGSGEYVGYDAARSNGFKSAAECTADPEFNVFSGYVEGCERYFK